VNIDYQNMMHPVSQQESGFFLASSLALAFACLAFSFFRFFLSLLDRPLSSELSLEHWLPERALKKEFFM